jgi:hypothetical protein
MINLGKLWRGGTEKAPPRTASPKIRVAWDKRPRDTQPKARPNVMRSWRQC